MSIKIKKAWMSSSTPLTAVLKHTKMRGQKTGLLSSLERRNSSAFIAFISPSPKSKKVVFYLNTFFLVESVPNRNTDFFFNMKFDYKIEVKTVKGNRW